MASILVTGASGLLGANFLLAAQRRLHTLTAMYHHCVLDVPGARGIRQRDDGFADFGDILAAARPDWIVHCAAVTNVDYCESQPDEALRINAEMPRRLAAAARLQGVRFLYVSTDSVFDGRAGNYDEYAQTGPLNVYARSKLAGEEAVRGELASALILRTNIYGWNAQEKLSLAEWILRGLKAKQAVPGFIDVVFNPLLANDLSEIMVRMMERQLEGLYNVGSVDCCSKFEFALKLAGVFDCDAGLVRAASIGDAPLKAPRPRNTCLGIHKISEHLGEPMPTLEGSLQRFKMLRDTGFVDHLKSMRLTKNADLALKEDIRDA